MLKTARLIVGAILLAASAAQAESSPGQRVVDLPLENGRSQRILVDAPSHPRATLVMLPGGTGEVGIQPGGALRRSENFVVRTRAAWVAQGYAVIIPDTIDQANLRGVRNSVAYGQVVDALAAYAKDSFGVPVFLIGTSQGTIAAVNGAARAQPGLIAGVVLTEPVSAPGRRSTETVFDAAPQDVRAPALVVANRDDRCPVAPPAMAERIVAALVGSPDARLLMVSGGDQRSTNPCSSLSPHGYLGIEGQVIDGITAWLKAHGG